MYQIVTIQKKILCFLFPLTDTILQHCFVKKTNLDLKQKSYTKKKEKKKCQCSWELLYYTSHQCLFWGRLLISKDLGETFLTSCCSMVSFFYYLFKAPYYLQSFCANKRKFIVIRIKFIFLVHWWVCSDLDDYFEYLLT